MKPQQYRAFAGLRNDIPEERFAPSDLSVATNVDTDETGRVYRRRGTVKLASGTAVHSLFSDNGLTHYADGSVLYRLNADYTGTSVQTGLTAGAPISYAAVNGQVYWGNGYQSGVLSSTGNRSFGLAPPVGLAVATTYGSMPAGRYGVAVTYVRNDGQESGTVAVQVSSLASMGGLQLSLPVSADPTVTRKNVYMTQTDGELPFFQGTYPNGLTTTTITDIQLGVVPLRTLARGPLPAPRVLAYFNGRLFGAVGSVIYHSDAYNFELADLKQNMLPFDAQVNMIAPVLDGMYVGTDTGTYFLSGLDPSEFQRRLVAPYGTLWGATQLVPGDFVTKEPVAGNVRLWMSKKGPCFGADGGAFKNMTSTRFIMQNASYGASLFRSTSGTYHFVSSVFA